MSFLNPANLWLLTFLTIPIAIHLLNRSKNKEIQFSSTHLIQKLKTTSLRRIELQKLFLLILRLLTILFLAFMLSQPVTKGFLSGWMETEQDSQLFIFIDNSASMSARNNGKTFLERSKHETVALLPLFKKQALISIIQTCPPKIVFEGFSNDPNIKKTVKSIQQTSSFDDIWGIVPIFLDDKSIVEPVKECIIFSDLMHSPDSIFSNSINNFNDWKFYFIQPPDIINNLSINNVTFENRVNTLQQLTKVKTRIYNNGLTLKKNIPVELLFNEQRVGQVISEFKSKKEKEFLFQAYPPEEGIMHSQVLIPPDNYLFDNILHHAIPVMNQINCGIIGQSFDDIKILEMILKSIDPLEQFLKIESRIQPDFNRLFLDEFDMVLIHNPASLSKKSVEDLDTFLKEGGGLIWFDGSDKSILHHESLYQDLNFPIPLTKINSGQGFFSTKIGYQESDLIQNIQVRNIKDELPQVFNYIKTKPQEKHIVHWELNNGDPFLIEFSKGGGDIFYFTSILNLDWNDLPIRGMIVPLIYRLLILTGTDENNTSSILIDDSKWISLSESKLRKKWEVISPSGKKEMIVPDYDREGIFIKISNELGVYKVFSNGEHKTSFATVLHPSEFLSKYLTPNDISSIISKKQSRWMKMDENLTTSFSEIRHGKALWKIFLCIVIILLIIETLVGFPQKKNLK